MLILTLPPDPCLFKSDGEFKSDAVLGDGNDKLDVVLLGEPEQKSTNQLWCT